MRKILFLLAGGICLFATTNFEEGVKKFLFHNSDYSHSLKFFQKSCSEDGIAIACNIAGQILNMFGEQEKADELYKKACDMGDLNACVMVGDMYNEGHGGFEVVYKKTRELYAKSCDAEVSQACVMVAYHYGNGIGGLKEDFKKSALLYEKACDLDHLQACITAAMIYKNGSGEVKKNLQKSAEFSKKACDLSFEEGCFEAKLLNKNSN